MNLAYSRVDYDSGVIVILEKKISGLSNLTKPNINEARCNCLQESMLSIHALFRRKVI